MCDCILNWICDREHWSMLLGMAEPREESYEMTVGVIYKPLTGEFYFASMDSDAIKRSKEGIDSK